MPVITGTFSGTGNGTATPAVRKAMFVATFAGTATVNVQAQTDGTNWDTLDSYTASFEQVYEAVSVPLRLNCSAHTDNVVYKIRYDARDTGNFPD